MAAYERPYIEPVEFRDDAGRVIDYGNRWTSLGGPPDESYSVDDHPERFAPLHTVAEALLEHLVTAYEVDVDEGPHVIADLLHPPAVTDIVRAVRLTPKDDASAPLVLVLTGYPGVRLYAGALFTTAYPSCGCNACDERWDAVADELEWQTLSIVGGGFAEEVSEPRRPRWSLGRHGLVQGMGQTVSYRLRALDGTSEQSGQSRAESVPAPVLEQAQARLGLVAAANPAGSWRPWPPRR